MSWGRSGGGALGPFRLGLFSLGLRIFLPPASAQDQAPDRLERLVGLFNRSRALDIRGEWDTQTGEVLIFYSGGVEGTFPWRRPDGKEDTVLILADRVVVLTRSLKEGPESPPVEGEKKKAGEEDALRFAPPRLYAEGNVRLESKGMALETDAFFYDAGRKRGLAVGVSGQGDLSAIARIGGAIDRREFSLLEERPDAGRGGGGGGWIGGAEPRPPPVAGPSAVPSTPTPPPPEARILAFRARRLALLDFEHFEGEGLVISPCQFGVAHLGVGAGTGRLYPAPAPAGREGAKEARQHYIIELEKNALEVQGLRVLPLPPLTWNTEWYGNLPLRRIQPGQSSKWGTRLDADWNLNWALERTLLSRLEPVDLFLKNSQLGFATDYRSKRGFGWGPEGVYGRDPGAFEAWELNPDAWTYYGEAGYYSIHDEGEDRTSDTQFEDPDRFWTHVLHRQSLKRVGILDVEFSERSDENFLNEYFERVAKSEKEQESLFYFRRHFRDNIALTGLYKYRTDDFETVVERIPEGKFFLLEQPVARTGLYGGLVAQGANLRQRPDEALGASSVRWGRFDALNEWSYPFGLGRVVRFRPFADLRYSEFERGVDPARGSIEREAFAAGITASQEYSRIFRLGRGGLFERWFGLTQLKHVVVPKVTYRNLYSNDVEPAELLQVDEVETVSTDERVELSLRTHLLGRAPPVAVGPQAAGGPPVGGPPVGAAPGRTAGAGAPAGEAVPRLDRTALVLRRGETRSLLEAEVSVDYFLHPGRDNAGNDLSLLDLDLAFRPSPRLALHTRTFFDPNEHMRFEQTDSGFTVAPTERLRLTVGERFTRDLTSFSYGLVGLDFSKRYVLDVYYAYDFELDQSSELEVRLIRIVHEWALELIYGVDFGEGKGHSFSVNLLPVQLLGEARRRRERSTTQ